MSLRRTGTRKAPAGASSRAKGYEVVQQGLQVVYPGENENVKSDIDVVFVPGLGAHPNDSWKSTKTDWNWMTSPDGIRNTCPKARILLYTYESAWQGPLKVNQFMDNISKTLLVALRSRREDCRKRPIVFIGHSMGGLVIAKAITILSAQPELCPVMFEAISAAVFFGMPFAGAPAAACALMYAHFAERLKKANPSELLKMMQPGDIALRELKDEFRRVASKTKYKIELLCFWEEQNTDFTKMAQIPGIFGIAKHLIPKDISEFVSEASATFEGDVPKYGLASDHRDLVKFDSSKDGRWNIVESLLKKTIHGAYMTAKNRLSAARDIDWGTFKSVMDALDSARIQPSRLRKALTKNPGKSSLISQEADYVRWLANIETGRHPDEAAKVDGLWIRGPEGRGKTGAMLAALDDVEHLVAEQENGEPILFAYFLCDAGTEYCTAEDCLKSIIWQLIEQEKALTTHAKDFVKEKIKNGTAKSRATPTVENLWKTLQGILADEFTGSCVYIILSNVHVLPEDSDSTIKLLKLLSLELGGSQMIEPSRVMAKWLVTSRPTFAIQGALKLNGLRVINLEDEKFGNQFQKTLQKHAKSKVDQLQTDKKYNKALAWFARSLIGERAQNTSWIDITCLQLEELPEAETDLRVRRMLEATPQALNALLSNAWLQIFRTSGDYEDNVREMLRALILTVEEPTESELAVLCGQDGSDQDKQELKKSIAKCKPLISVKRTVSFMSSAVKEHLNNNIEEFLGLSAQEIARQHGLLSLRSLSYLKSQFDFPEKKTLPSSEDTGDAKEGSDVDAAASVDGSDGTAQDEETESEADEDSDDDDDGSSIDNFDNWDDDSEPDLDPEAQELEDRGVLPYMVKNWLQHGSRATIGFADDLSLDDEFWKPLSLLRRRWLVEYDRNTKEFEYQDIRGMNALHVVAAIGFKQLLTALIENGHEEELDGCDGNNATPLCFACEYGKADMVEELLDRKADINAGEKEMEDTPLHLAANMGHVDVMQKLIRRGAKLDAYSEYSGLVLNSAISSGNLDTIEILVKHGVKLLTDRDDVQTPLEQAASLCDVSTLEYLMKNYTDQLVSEEYSKALIAAAAAGSLEVLNKLLPFEHSHEDYQSALDNAAEEGNWGITKVLLESRINLSCDKVFYKAATRTDDLEVLDALWEYTNGNISAETLDQSLYETTDNKKTKTVQILLEKFGADANARGRDYGNALTASAYDGTLDILKLLLDHGANVESDDGWALQTAATEGHIDIVKELLSRGGKVNQKTNHANFPQQTALQGACELGRGEIVDILLDHGADPNLGGGEDNYPIITAARNIQVEIIGKLISAHADVNVVGGDDGDTALIIVAKKIASLEPLKQLLEAGAAIDATNNNGDTALISAASSGDDEFVSFLLAKGADVLHTNNQGINAMQAASENDNPGDTLNILIKYVSTILSGINSRVQAGDQAVIDVVNEAKAMAQKANKTDHEIDTNEPSTENDQELYEDQEGHFNPEEVSIEVKADEITEQLVPIDQTFLSQSAAGSVAEVCHKVETSFMPQQDQTHNDYYTRPSNNDTYLCSNAAQQQTSINKADQFSNHGWVQQRETLYQQEQTVDSNHSLPGQHIIYQGVEAGQTHDVMPERNQVTPVRRKPAPIAYNTPHHSQTLAYAEPPSDQQSNTLYHQSSTFVAYDPRNNQSRPHSPPQNYPSQANAQNLYQPAYYDPGYPAAPQYSFPQESSHYESRPQPMHAYSSPTPLHQQQQPVRLSNANHATTPPPQNSRSSFFGVKNTLGQARGRLFSSNRREDSGR